MASGQSRGRLNLGTRDEGLGISPQTSRLLGHGMMSFPGLTGESPFRDGIAGSRPAMTG